MHPFVVGDLVECIDDRLLPGRVRRGDDPWVSRGCCYQVIKICTNTLGEHGVVLAEVRIPPPGVAWYAWRFRKIVEGKDPFAALLYCVTVQPEFEET